MSLIRCLLEDMVDNFNLQSLRGKGPENVMPQGIYVAHIVDEHAENA